MERFSIAIERLGYLQEESVDLFSLVDADVFASWLDHFEVPHALRTDGTIEVRIYSICVPSPLERYIAHEDEDYSSDDYDLWTVDPAIFEAAAFIRQIAGTEVVTELIDEAYGIWTAGTALGAFSPTMDRDELEEAFGQLYRGHYASVTALLVQNQELYAGCGFDDVIPDRTTAVDDIPALLGIVGKDGFWFHDVTARQVGDTKKEDD